MTTAPRFNKLQGSYGNTRQYIRRGCVDYANGLLVYAYIPVLAYSRLDITSERAKLLARLMTQRHFSAILDNDAVSFLPK